MRIKRVAFTGTFILFIGCLTLYLLLDRTFTVDHRLADGSPRYVSHQSSKVTTHFNTSSVRSVERHAKFDWSLQCAASHFSPKVDVQMSHVYDILKFDNIDGGVWKQGWNIAYNENQWGPDRKLKIFVVPHSHNDPGWKKTFEDYFRDHTRSIFNNMVKKLAEDSRRKFIWAEISFFSLWWSEISNETKAKVKELVNNGQLEFVTGGWVMPDEANSHYYSILEQLVHGNQWLLQNLDYIPKHSWSIDPFGVSPTLPYLLKKSGFESLVVQRVHYSVKKYLARKKLLEFNWVQLWDGEGYSGLLTHMMPFFSYDVPHTCGPDPKICCQFDFRRMPGYALSLAISCPWRVPAQPITDQNVAYRASLLLDQYRKKAQLYSSNVVLAPLGDDFRYDTATEWDVQYTNYQKLFDYINSNSYLNAHAQFGTLKDYFDALLEEHSAEDFPTLSGDFFTYADRDDYYWSGYYTSRPFYKRMDRVLMSYLRSAEILLNTAIRMNKTSKAWPRLLKELGEARSSLSLFQHHDGITGTAKDHVVLDYARKMMSAILGSQHIIQQSAHFLLSDGKSEQTGEEGFFVVDDHQKMASSLPEQRILRFPTGIQARHITFYNSLLFRRREIVSVKVENRLVLVRDGAKNQIPYQISPVCHVFNNNRDCYLLSFEVDVPPLSLVTYSVEAADEDKSTHAHVTTFNDKLVIDDWTEQKEESPREFSVQNDKFSVAFSRLGLLKAITLKLPDGGITIPTHLSFVKYTARSGPEMAGAYIFLPEGEAETVKVVRPKVAIVEGKLMSQVIVQLPNLVHSVIVHNTQGADSHGIEIHNFVDLTPIKQNFELAMRFSTDIKNENVIYTDLNGIQIIRRKRLAKLPLQGNYYPMPTAAYIEDSKTRLTLLTGQPLGGSSLREGQIEIMQDRKLFQDDNRGLDQGVTDNKPTLNIFRLVVETRLSNCHDGSGAVWGRLSKNTYEALQGMLHPLQKLHWLGDSRAGPGTYSQTKPEVPPNLHLVTTYTLPDLSTGLILHSSHFDSCISPVHHATPVNLSGIINLKKDEKVFRSTLTFTDIHDELVSDPLSLCDNDVLALYLKS